MLIAILFATWRPWPQHIEERETNQIAGKARIFCGAEQVG
jgi:hypothetical protein